jgi:hypothetical protein
LPCNKEFKKWCLKPKQSRRLFVEQEISGFKSRQTPLL